MFEGKECTKKEEEILKRIAKRGARAALIEIGLDDRRAGEDIRELREWLSNFRLIKREFKQTTVKLFTTGFWLVLLAGTLTWLSKNIKFWS